eukprot:CAMPEP_0202906448 /NCGR_PEP_ID=MMETSP1392-20130828/38997_1 /ASSEMBLY_ACC=CAM_ASM_000868 /TAXON_ID=225041 /ORGANISM="Chlamydomonas chlamydogama, Strain SAG 11-48b" /LENGTH=284 /DNA_ID=CAMNT_0049594969 /DNA_START=63 /DNA_END=917 /DNA_ORIENTATION=+
MQLCCKKHEIGLNAWRCSHPPSSHRLAVSIRASPKEQNSHTDKAKPPPAWPSNDLLISKPARPSADQLARRPPATPPPAASNPTKPQLQAPAHAQQPAPQRTNLTTQAKESPGAVATHVLGVDYGTKWTGLAVGINGTCDALQVIPSGSSMADLSRHLVQLALDKGLQGVVVGLPINPMKGGSLTDPSTDNPVAQRCRALAHAIAMVGGSKGLEVYLYDEASTSSDALLALDVKGWARHEGLPTSREKLRRKVDAYSAMMLVRRFINKPGLAVRVKIRGAAAQG